MKTLTLILLSLFACSITAAQYANVDDLNKLYLRTVADNNSMYLKLKARIEADSTKIACLEKQLATQPSATSTTSIDEAKIVEVVKKHGFVTRQDGDRRWINMRWSGGVREQIEGKIAATNTRVDTTQTASSHHSLRLQKLEQIASRHDEQIKGISFDLFKTQLVVLKDKTPIAIEGQETDVKAGEWAQEELKASIKKKLHAALNKDRESSGDNTEQ